MVGNDPWEVDLRTGNHWPIISDAETPEEEVEMEIQQRGEEVERAEGAGRAEDDPLMAAREVIRVEVR